MRKFRAWDKENGCYVKLREHPQLVLRLSGTLTEGSTTPDYILEQFTGLLDKAGKEIWEGDIVHYDVAPFDNHTNFVVRWFPGHYNCCGIMIQAGINDLACYPEGEVIGNKFEHPSLLEQSIC